MGASRNARGGELDRPWPARKRLTLTADFAGEPRRLIAIYRIHPQVLARFRDEARRGSVGYQTLIDEILARLGTFAKPGIA